MDSSTGCCRLFDIKHAARACAIAFLATAVTSPLAPPPRAQSIDSTVEQQVEDDVESDVTGTVEDEIEDQVESDLTSTVEDEVESDVTSAVEDSVESDVAGTVEAEVEDQVESDITATVEDEVQNQVESDVTDSVEQQVESGITDTVEQQIESGVVDTLEQEIESGVTGAVEASLTQTIERQLEAALGDHLGDDLDDAVEQVSELVEELGIEDVAEALEQAAEFVDEERDGDAAADEEASEPGSERYAAGVDDLDRAAEDGVWVILVPSEHTARIQDWGFTVRERRDLDVLDRVLLRVDAPGDRGIAQAALELALDAPGTSVDFNHVYTADAGQAAAGGGASAAAGRPEAATRGGGLEVGIIDTRIAAGHEALAQARIEQRDFAVFEGARPDAHGTAVASILVGESAPARGVLAGARLHAASVFFEGEGGSQVATTDALVSALEWLAGRGVGVVNMSLSGPPNRVLEAAIEEAAGRGAVIVAAVGNNGPGGKPLYPAAYDDVVGVTAVDSAHRVYHYANRGRHVMFSAPGVDVRVALGSGGYTTQSGTSMAAPYAAAVVARSLDSREAPAEGVLDTLKASAVDLGEKDFDEIYGYGLIAALE